MQAPLAAGAATRYIAPFLRRHAIRLRRSVQYRLSGRFIAFPYQEFLLLAIFQAAGWPIWLLLIASIVALALIIERLLYLRRAKILPRKLFDEVVQVYRSGKITPDTLAKLEDNSPLGVVLAAALRNVDAPREVMKESIEEAGSGVAHTLERFLTTLGTIATLAPLMGLFGHGGGHDRNLRFAKTPVVRIPHNWPTASRWPCITRASAWPSPCRPWSSTAISVPSSTASSLTWSSKRSSSSTSSTVAANELPQRQGAGRPRNQPDPVHRTCCW